MFARKSLQSYKIFKSNYVLKRYLKEAVVSSVSLQETQLEPLPKKKPQRTSYLKTLLKGKIDEEMFVFPEQKSIRYDAFFKWFNPIENYISNYIELNKKLNKNQVLEQLRELEVFRTHIDEHYLGLSLSKTESTQLIETLSNLPWLGTYILKNHILPLELISKYGSKQQKLKYFPKIMSGEITPTICIYEGDYGTNVKNIKSYVIPDEGNSWVLNGEKTFVANGTDSNLFLVFTKNYVGGIEENISDSFSLFLVERDFGGVTCTDIYDTIGRHEIPTCTINFKDTPVPGENIIGKSGDAFDILMTYLKPGNQNISGQAISILRNFLNLLIPDILKMKHFDRNLHQFDVVKKIIGEIIVSLYTMESMTYITTGLIDKYENQDAELEQIITEKYCANKCLNCIQTGLQLVGAKSYLNNKLYLQAFHDALAITTMDTNNIDAEIYVAVSTLKYVGAEINEHIIKKRNYFKFPVYNMMDSILDASRTKIFVKDSIHPSLSGSIVYLEESLHKFKESIIALLSSNGTKIIDQYSDLKRITDMLTEIYAMFANLSRSSRSYCIGVRNADIEKDIGIIMTYVSYSKINAIAEDIRQGRLLNGDYCYANIMDLAYKHRKYPMKHPLHRTF